MRKPLVYQVGTVEGNGFNGVHAAIANLADLLSYSGCDIAVIHLTRAANQVNRRRVGPLRVVDIPVHAAPGTAGSHLQVPTREGRKELKRLVGGAQAIHMHSVFQPDHVWTRQLSKRLIITPHGGYHPMVLQGSNSAYKDLWLSLLDSKLLARADVVQVLSNREGQDVRRVQARSRTRRLNLPLIREEQIAESSGIRRTPRGFFTFIGRLDTSVKGLDILLDAWASSTTAMQGASLQIRGPSHNGSLEWLQCALHMDSRLNSVNLGGAISGIEKEAFLREASWFVQPSRREGLPGAPIEAMARGIPVIVSEATNLGDVVRGSNCGFVTDGSTASLIEALSVARSLNTRQYCEMSDAARGAALQGFTWNKLKGDYWDMFGLG